MIRHRRPQLDEAHVLAHLEDRYGLEGTLVPLPGERDLNLLLVSPDGGRHVVKATSPDEPEETLVFETELLAWLAEEGETPTPAVVPDLDGERLTRCEAPGGAVRVRVLEHLAGDTLAKARPRSDGLLEALGAAVAGLGVVLARHPRRPPPRADFDWELARAGSVMEGALPRFRDGWERALLESARRAFEATGPVRARLPAQLVHGDVNDHNVLVSPAEPGRHARRVTGLLDFGDAHAAPAVHDLAIAVAYALLGQKDPMHAAARVVAGYHRVRALSEEELGIVMPLARARLGASVSISAGRRREDPEPDPYLLVSEAPAWEALAALDVIAPALAEGLLRHACGMEPCARSAAVRAWLAERTPRPAVAPPRGGGTCVLDLSVGSPLLDGRDTEDVDRFSRRIFRAMAEEEATRGIGRWMEPRGFYLTDAFAGRPSEMPERRTVHLGVDAFVPAGTPVHAPLAGRVAAVADHAARLDYGPTVILEHETPHGPVWTLYGHLDGASVEGLAVGAEIAAGDVFARVGAPPENGDWPPHLHLQLALDRMGREDEVPGVAPPRERAVWASLCPDPSALLGPDVDAAWREPEGLIARRARVLAPSLSLSYAEPVHAVRGAGAHLFDVFGRAHLDVVNNVAHVGHEHPRVVAAGRRQMGVLNTNSRYLHDSILRYAERLAALLPDPLSVCVFVNSGSEANELALRMARARSGGKGVVALEGGYHGNTAALVDVSHYKFAGPGGEGPPPWVRAAPMPDDYRGPFRRDDPDRAARYADGVRDALADLAAEGVPPAAFLAESVLSCGGQIVLPDGYLERAYAHAREAGAVCIADEVQVGFGRVGTHLWGFETQGVVPDIVTLGKPIGNGHPLGAVVTTPEIAARFATGMEFFSTFGGNPVSCEIGLAVLDVLEEEGLQAHAARVGRWLLAALRELRAHHDVVGDARGLGLFLGLELVADREARTPSAEAASYVVGRMRERGILLSTDGPDRNVIKLKPPLPFSLADAERLVAELDDVLGEDPVRAVLSS